MIIEWDESKEKTNIKKHGIDFETASRVFNDSFRIELYDKKHSRDLRSLYRKNGGNQTDIRQKGDCT